jgi:aryl-alcohol dehydrogenase-like predicted oxidoreductase
VLLHTILEEYVAAGGNLIDTADVYGQGVFEELIAAMVPPVAGFARLAGGAARRSSR